MPTPAELMDKIKNARFSTTRLRPGYDEGEVDTFLDKLVAALSADQHLDAAELTNVRFTATRLRPGYVQQDVDDLLAELGQYAR